MAEPALPRCGQIKPPKALCLVAELSREDAGAEHSECQAGRDDCEFCGLHPHLHWLLKVVPPLWNPLQNGTRKMV